MNMIDTILDALKKTGIETWRVLEKNEESAELFFVKKQLDTRRTKDTKKYEVTVYRDGEADGKKTRGMTQTEILSSDSAEVIETKLSDAYFAAGFAMNPYYDLPDPVKAPTVVKTGALAEKPLAVSAGIMTEALFAPDHRQDAFLNSAEIFVSRYAVRILTSRGTDVSYTDAEITGEYVVQCREPEDVEMFHQFSYTECEPEALKKQVEEALDYVADRARAEKTLKSGEYDVVLCGEELVEVMGYYPERSHASMVYAQYSTWKPGDDVQKGDAEAVIGEKLNLTLCPTVPYSAEGIPMKERTLLSDGKMNLIYGPNRFCRYLGIEPTGDYERFCIENKGSESVEEMKKKPCLWAVAFSDFQMDSFSGHFGGEIRLAYLIDGEKKIPVTGGSINGSLIEAQQNFVFSTERYTSAAYEGPYAVRLKKISVAGAVTE